MLGQIEQVAPDWLRNMMLFIAGAVVTAYYIRELIRGGKTTTEITTRPIEVEGEVKVSPKGRRFNGELCDAKHRGIDEKVAALEGFTRSEVKQLHDEIKAVGAAANMEVKAIRAEIMQMELRINSADEERTSRLHTRLNDIFAELGKARRN